jgi:imidazolonepropionase-like amidohydrolase
MRTSPALAVLAQGRLADLLVLDGNPLDDIRQTRNIRDVMGGGIVHTGE